MRKPIIYVDLDGVVADLGKEMDKHIPDWRTTPDDDKKDKQVNEMCQNNPGIFLHLEPIIGAVDAVKELFRYFEVYFLSTPMWTLPRSYSDKRLWVEKYWGEDAKKRLILSHRKDLNIGDYLIDDRTHNGAGEFVGEHIHFGTEKYPDWVSVLAYLENKHPFMVSENKVKVKISSCKTCGGTFRNKISHTPDDGSFDREVEQFDLDVKEVSLYDFRESSSEFCSCSEEIIQVCVVEHNDHEGETFSYILNMKKHIAEKLKVLIDSNFDTSEWTIRLNTDYTKEKVDELNSHVDNNYMDFINFYELRDPRALDNIDEDFEVDSFFYKGSDLKKVR